MAVSCRTAAVASFARRVGPRVSIVASLQRSGGHHEDHTLEPPFHRLPLPSKPLHEEDELIWNDSVAPETCIDFDAPHIGATEGLLWWLGGFGFFYSIWLYAKSTDHPNKKISAVRELPASTLTVAMGGYGQR